MTFEPGDVSGTYEGDDPVGVEYARIIYVSEGAVLFEIDGNELWIPLSLIADIDADWVMVALWWAKKNDLEVKY
jgi:hypothetical protein